MQDDYTATFTGYAMWKDLTMALAAAHDAHAPLPVTATIQQLLEGLHRLGLGDLDLMALLPRLRRGGRARARAVLALGPGSASNLLRLSSCRPTTTQMPRTGSSPRFVKLCGTAESNEIESPGPST